MSTPSGKRALPEADSAIISLLLAVDPHGLGGAILRGMPGPTRDAWLKEFAALMPPGAPLVRVPVNVGHDRLVGGLDFGATMAAGRPVFASGLLEMANDGVLVVSMAERLAPAAAAIISSTLDSGEIVIERDGMTGRKAVRTGIVALDEGIDDERVCDSLADRLAFSLQLDDYGPDDVVTMPWSGRDVARARQALPSQFPAAHPFNPAT